jgi:hypothetical protein
LLFWLSDTKSSKEPKELTNNFVIEKSGRTIFKAEPDSLRGSDISKIELL